MRMRWIVSLTLAAALSLGAISARTLAQPANSARSQQPAAPAPDTAPEPTDKPSPPENLAPDVSDDATQPFRFRRGFRRHGYGHEHDIVSIGRNSVLPKGQSANSVVSVFGSSTSDGDAGDSVVSVFGDTRATGNVGNSVVAVFGDVYVDGKVGDTVVAVLGDVELGPNAEVNGDIVTIGGTFKRAENATVHGGVQEIASGIAGGFRVFRPWIVHCLVFARPLAFASGLEWAWGIALGFLALYVLIAVAFREGVERCVKTIEVHPGRTVLASILVPLLTPWVMLLLTITVVGLIAIPFVWLALLCATLFGKAVILSWIGRRCLSMPENPPVGHVALAVLVGGGIILLAYVVPLLGAIVFSVLGMLGVGVVVYTLLLQSRQARPAAAKGGGPGPVPPPPAAGPPPATGPAPEAAATASAFLGSPHDPYEASTAFATGEAAAAGGPQPSPAEAASAMPGGPPPTPGSAPHSSATMPELSAPRAGFFERILALAVDAILVGVVLGFLHTSREFELLALATYAAVMWNLKGTTIGGIVFNLKILRVDGRPLDWPTVIVRALSCFLSLAAVGLGFIWIAIDDEHQAWHDKIAGTIVVRLPKGVALV